MTVKIDLSQIPLGAPLNIIIGASSQSYPGWIQTQEDQLNVLHDLDWSLHFHSRKIDAILAEHVWEHLNFEEGVAAARNCFAFMNRGAHIRCAVPDRFFRNEAYQKLVQVGGPGPADHPAASHKIVHDYQSLTRMFEEAGFDVKLLEYCDEQGRFHFHEWNPEEGFIYRSKRFDHRNQDGELGFVSLIVDAIKP
ncbi:class I SAM-dependent methyltransferase [Paenibacillus sp. 481]|uniref:class I SAM-dependent methyltransferase n=1 Tax=Paenibacillus sp. 481 TaxID=2835869 RepID=UPI001E487B79|nr:SAM-dependent methyltransferase [Paenibacillus sp. 481]UHA73678.1 SAM-dependent methyltransferase [Paenibacillus sp. 481]